MSAIEDLHESAFGYRPDKQGTAYERLAAVVLATLGWANVVHGMTVRPPGKRARHQLDVTARHPDGHIRRLIVECKDWDKTVGKRTLDALVGVRSQVGADALAVLTTRGFTKGAVHVASDEDVLLVVLRAFDPGNPHPFVQTVEFTLDFCAPVRSNVGVDVCPGSTVPAGTRLRGADRLLHLDGSPAETVYDVVMAHASPLREGVFPQRAEFPDGRLLPSVDDGRSAITALYWTETMNKSSIPQTMTVQGEPELVLEQLDEHGDVANGRVVVDRDLYAWYIDVGGRVVPRGKLGGTWNPAGRSQRSAAT